MTAVEELRVLIARLRATSYLHYRGPDYELLPVPPSALALEAADALDAAKDQLRYFGELHEKEFRASEARATALEKALEPFEEVADEGNEDQPDDTPCTIQAGRSTCYGFTLKQFRAIRALLSAKGGET